MIFGRRTLLKWIGSIGTAIAGEILSPSGLLSLPAEALVLPPRSIPMCQYDCLLNQELMKLDEKEFHEAFVVPGIHQIGGSFFESCQPMRFLDATEVAVKDGQKRIVFPRGGVYVLERSFTPSFGHAASLYAMVMPVQQESE